MITKWHLFNFKSVRDAVDLELRPLTIFAGSNSSGKSTVLQSMLLVSQTLSSKVSSRSVVLNGPMLRLGQFDDLTSFDSDAEHIEIGWQCRPISSFSPFDLDDLPDREIRNYLLHRGRLLETVDCTFSFDVDDEGEVSQLRPGLLNCEIDVNIDEGTFRDGKQQSSLKIKRSDSTVEKIRGIAEDQRSLSLLSSLDYDILSGSSKSGQIYEEAGIEFISREPVGCTLDHFLPQRLVTKYNTSLERAGSVAAVVIDPYRFPYGRREFDWIVPPAVIRWVRDRLKDFEPVQNALDERTGLTLEELVMRIRFSAREQTRGKQVASIDIDMQEAIQELEAILAEEKDSTEEVGEFALATESLPRAIGEGVSYLESFFSSYVKYLGPLRDEPKPLYPLAPSVDPSEIGLKGEYTASVLDLFKQRRVDYLSPHHLSLPKERISPKKALLKTAILDWLKYMGVVEDFRTEDRGKLGHELKVMTPGTRMPHDLTHVGVGVSQVLPILVMCLLAEPDTTIIIEQPELHLHPKVQTLLGDFFLSMALLDKQIIVETHSEYIVNRLRYRAAEADGEQLSSLMKIYFAEKEQGSSVFREVNVNQYGAIMDWPKGFFDQSQEEADRILRSAIEKKERSRKSRLEKRDE